MEMIEWERIWEEIYEERKKLEYRDPGIEYWDKRVKDFFEARKPTTMSMEGKLGMFSSGRRDKFKFRSS